MVRVLFHMLEAGIYVMIFKHIMDHERSMFQYMTRRAIKRKQRNSAISVGCEMSMDVVEWLFEVLLLLSKHTVSWNLIMTLYQTEFAVKTVVQALASEIRRTVIARIVRRRETSTTVSPMEIRPQHHP